MASGERQDYILPAPWQELRLQPHLSFQLDILITEHDLQTMYNELDLFWDLQLMYRGMKIERIPEYQVPYKKHIPAQPQPLYKFYNIKHTLNSKVISPLYKIKPQQDSDGAVFNEYPNDYNIGLKYKDGPFRCRLLDMSYDWMVGVKTLKDGRVQVSGVMFIIHK